MARARLDVKQAAHHLGISTDAVHKRVKRGTLESEKDDSGHVYVWLDSVDNDYTQDSQGVQPLLIARLEDENEFLRRELEQRSEELSEMRRIVAALVQRVPELEPTREAPREPRESDISAPEERGNGEVPPEQEKPVSWWRRWFGG
jgi:DNA-directed RNA polymerase specialized sigma24 family protein